MNKKGQGALEYLLLIGGAVLIAAIVITLVSTMGASGTGAGKSAALDALCMKFPQNQCGSIGDPDGDMNACATSNCTWSNNTCQGNPTGICYVA